MSRGYYRDGVFDLHVSFASDVTEQEIDEWRQSWAQASRLLYKATHGQLRFGTISYGMNGGCKFADAWLIGRDGRSCTDGHFTEASGQMMLMHQVRERPYVIVHEFGHYAFFLKDEYAANGKGMCIPRNQAAIARACIMEWNWASGDQLEFPSGTVRHGAIYEYCCKENHTHHNAEEADNHMSCWDEIHLQYPDVSIPDTATTFDKPLETEIDWVPAKCGTHPLVYLGDGTADSELGAAAIGAGGELSDLQGFRPVHSMSELAAHRDVKVCATPLIVPVPGLVDIGAWRKCVEGSRIRAFPIAVTGTDVDLEGLRSIASASCGRVKVFDSAENLQFRMQSYLAEIAAEMDCGAGLCCLYDTVFASEPARARQACIVPVDEKADSVVFAVSLDGDMDISFVAVDPAGNAHRFAVTQESRDGAQVHRIEVRNPVAGNWTVNLGRATAGDIRRATVMAIAVNHHVHATFEVKKTDKGATRLEARGYWHRFLLSNLHVEAHTLGGTPKRFTFKDNPQVEDGYHYRDGLYAVTLPDDLDTCELMITLTSGGDAYSPYWKLIAHADQPQVPHFYRTQRVTIG